MIIITRWKFILFCLFLFSLLTWPASAETPVNLLRLPSATLETTSLVGDQASSAAALTDGKRDTAASIDAGGADTVDLVFGFAGETVAPEAIVIVLAKGKAGTPPARVEVLASTVSPQSGFKSLRADPIKNAATVQNFAFPPAAARWIMVRLTLAKKGAPLSLAEIEILGHPGEPKTNYAFSETPARAIDILSRLEKVSAVSLAISADEKQAFQKAKAGRLDWAAFADVALLASGILDAAKRKQYLDRIEGIAGKAQAAVASARDAKERGDALLRWLHREVLKKGYRATQTDLSGVLDEQAFNCVSSAVLYNIIALKLGLDVRAIEVPDHAFSIVYQGTSHMDVETTNALGFNPSRDQIKNFERMTGFRYVPDSHRDQRREVTEAGLAALIYYNRGVSHGLAKRHHDALLAYFRAMSLDPEFASAAKNALATLANWSLELSQQKQWQKAVDVISVGVELAPNDAALVNNQNAIWSNWVMSLVGSGQFDAALAVIDGAGERFKDQQGKIKLAEYIVDSGARAKMKAQSWDDAANLYAHGLKRDPENALLRNNAVYLAQQWMYAAVAKGGAPTLMPVARQAIGKFPDLPKVREVLIVVVNNSINEKVKAKDFRAAADLVEQTRDYLPPDKSAQLLEFSYYKWAESYMTKKQWGEAVKIYDQGLKQLPESSLFKQNRAYCAVQAGQ
jgi:tetratricopeptide (TPR) repeat protein